MQESTLRSTVPAMSFRKIESSSQLSSTARKTGKPMDLSSIVNVGGSPRDYVGSSFNGTLQSSRNIPARSIHNGELPAQLPTLRSSKTESISIDYTKQIEQFTHRYTRYGFSRQASALGQIVRARSKGLFVSDVFPLCEVLGHIRYLYHRLASETGECSHEQQLNAPSGHNGSLHSSRSPRDDANQVSCSCRCCLLAEATVELLPTVQTLLDLFSLPVLLEDASGLVDMTRMYPVLLKGMQTCFSFTSLRIPTLVPTLCNIALKLLQHFPQPLDVAYRGEHVPMLTALSRVNIEGNQSLAALPANLSYGVVLLIESHAIGALLSVLDLERTAAPEFCSCEQLHRELVLQDPDYSPSNSTPAQCYCSSRVAAELEVVSRNEHIHSRVQSALRPLLLDSISTDIVVCTVLNSLDILCGSAAVAGCFVHFGLFSKLLQLMFECEESALNWTARQIPASALRLLFRIFKTHTSIFLDGAIVEDRASSPQAPTQGYFLSALRKEEQYVNVLSSIWFVLSWELHSIKAKHYNNTILALLHALITPADAALVLLPLQLNMNLFSTEQIHTQREKHEVEDITAMLFNGASPLSLFIAQILVVQHMFKASEDIGQTGVFSGVLLSVSAHLTIPDIDALRYCLLICVRLAQHSNVLQQINNEGVVRSLLHHISFPSPLPQHLVVPKDLLVPSTGDLDYSQLGLSSDLPVITVDNSKASKRHPAELVLALQSASLIGLNQLVKLLPSCAGAALPQLLTFATWEQVQAQAQAVIEATTQDGRLFDSTLDSNELNLTLREYAPVNATAVQSKPQLSQPANGFVPSKRVALVMDTACTVANVCHGGLAESTQEQALETLVLLLSTVLYREPGTQFTVTPRIAENLPLLTSILVFSSGIIRESGSSTFLLRFIEQCFPLLLVLLASSDIHSVATLQPETVSSLLDVIYTVCAGVFGVATPETDVLSPAATRLVLVLPSLTATLCSVVARAPTLAFPGFVLLDYITTQYPPALDGVRQWVCPFPSTTLSGANAGVNLLIHLWKQTVNSFETSTEDWPHSLLYPPSESSLDTVLISSLAVLSGLCPSHPFNYTCFELLVPCTPCVCHANPCFCQHLEVPLNIPMTQPLVTMMHALKHADISTLKTDPATFVYQQLTTLAGTGSLPPLSVIKHCYNSPSLCSACETSFLRQLSFSEQSSNIALLCISLLKKLEVIPTLPVLSTRVDGHQRLIEQAGFISNQQQQQQQQQQAVLTPNTRIPLGTSTQQIGAMPNVQNMTFEEADEDFFNALSLSEELLASCEQVTEDLDLSVYNDLRDIARDVPLAQAPADAVEGNHLVILPSPTVENTETLSPVPPSSEPEQDTEGGVLVTLAQQSELCVQSVFHVLPSLARCRQMAVNLLCQFLEVPAAERTTTNSSALITCMHNLSICLTYLGHISQARYHINQLREERLEEDAQHTYTQILLRKTQLGAKLTTDRAGKKIYGQVKVKTTSKQRK